MKMITDIAVGKKHVGGADCIVCTVTAEDGATGECVGPWISENGIWASRGEARNPAEIAAWLRNFARAIEKWAA